MDYKDRLGYMIIGDSHSVSLYAPTTYLGEGPMRALLVKKRAYTRKDDGHPFHSPLDFPIGRRLTDATIAYFLIINK